MRNTLTTTLLVIVTVGTFSSLNAQEKPLRKEIHRQYQLAPNTTVEVSMIAGPVEVETTSDQSAEVNIINSAETQADLNCEDTQVEQTSGKLEIYSKAQCSIVRVNQRVMLKLPRNVNLALQNIAGHVSIGPTEAMVHLNSIAGHVSANSLQSAEISSLAEGLSMEIKQLGKRGLRLSSIVGGVELALSDNLNAQFEASSVIGNVVSDIPNVKVSTDDQSNVFAAQIGSGGPRINVSSVRGGIRLRKLD